LLEPMLKYLQDEQSSCVILKNKEVFYRSSFIGVKPLLKFMESYKDEPVPSDLVLVDKIIGKAALLLSVKLGIREIYTPLASLPALEAAQLHGVQLYAKITVPYIVNRDKTGMCPLEESVLHTMDPEEAFLNIKAAITKLMAGKP
jgi:hypothetical protein